MVSISRQGRSVCCIYLVSVACDAGSADKEGDVDSWRCIAEWWNRGAKTHVTSLLDDICTMRAVTMLVQYDTANHFRDLLPMSSGVYGADLGPDPRDAMLTVKAFGLNRPCLALLKHSLDPGNVLA
jgi:hypothetical protein